MDSLQMEYDDEGANFSYFLLSLAALILFLVTYFLWQSSHNESDTDNCECPECSETRNAPQTEMHTAKKIGLVIAWLVFIYMAYKVLTNEANDVDFDPFYELGISQDASAREIKKAFHKKSLIYHPDRETGDLKKFKRISKAYAALTNAESRYNLLKYGNPNGPSSTRFGMALPKWLVEESNSSLVLAAYGVIFLVAIPVILAYLAKHSAIWT